MTDEQKLLKKQTALDNTANKLGKHIDFYTFQMVREDIIKELDLIYTAGHKDGYNDCIDDTAENEAMLKF